MTVISADAPLEILTGYVPGLPQLAEPDYSPSTFDYLPRAQLAARGQPAFPALEDWIRIFKEAVPNFQDTAAKDPSVPESRRQELAARFAELYIGSLEELESRGATAAASGDVDARPVTSCLDLVRLREKALRDAGFTDIFRPIKRLENEKALELLPEVCEEIDGIADPRQRWEAVVRGVFAGNIFDLGCTTTTEMYHEKRMSFHDTREKLVSRPWVIDCLDEMLDRVTTHTYNKAVLFVDNAGADVILGMLPLARELLKRGTTVVVAANELPSINDMTAAELEALLPQICSSDALLCKAVSSQRLRVVSSGSGLPVIDLSQVSHELADACVDADLVILEGMGRSIETNLNARFSVDSLKLGMIKHQEVASALGGRIYDCVCKFDRGGGVA